jgi:dCMP deaminase
MNDQYLPESEGPNKWDVRWMNRAILNSTCSKDPNEQVGCIIINQHRHTLSDGYNGFPRGIKDDKRLTDKLLKNLLIVHAEANAVASAADNGHSLRGGTCYVNRHPCTQCTALLIQAGIQRIVYYHPEVEQSSYFNNFRLAAAMLAEAGVSLTRMQ